jgi:hypothetical protein
LGASAFTTEGKAEHAEVRSPLASAGCNLNVTYNSLQ